MNVRTKLEHTEFFQYSKLEILCSPEKLDEITIHNDKTIPFLPDSSSFYSNNIFNVWIK